MRLSCQSFLMKWERKIDYIDTDIYLRKFFKYYKPFWDSELREFGSIMQTIRKTIPMVN